MADKTDKTSKPIHTLLKYIAVPLAIAGIVIAAILLTPRKENATMTPVRTPTEVEDTTIPVIDRNAPTDTETATFAMG